MAPGITWNSLVAHTLYQVYSRGHGHSDGEDESDGENGVAKWVRKMGWQNGFAKWTTVLAKWI